MKDENATMLIANPIYDVVFKYMLEDDKVAKIFLSALLGKEVLELTFMPQETAMDANQLGKKKKEGKKPKKHTIVETTGLSIYRLDFSAKVRMPDGSSQLIILELQKSKLRTDTVRFRTYLGKQYMNTDLVRWIANNQPHNYSAGIPIFPIFILGEGLEEEHYKDVPVIQISNCVRDRHSTEPLEKESVFIASMFHEGLIVNVPALSDRRRNDLEKLLAVFDQSQVDASLHIMNIREKEFEPRYHPLIRRLQQAASSHELRDRMQREDLFLSEYAGYERDLARSSMELALATKRADEEALKNAVERHLRVEAQKEKEEAQKREAEAQKEKEEAQKREAEAQKENASLQTLMAKMMQEQGKSIQEIAKMMGITANDAGLLLQ